MADKCVYCMLLLAHPYCHFATAWQSLPVTRMMPASQATRRHFATRSLFTINPEQQQTPTTVDVDTVDTSLTPQMIRNAYDSRETDGILELAKTMPLLVNELSPLEIVQASVKAADGNKGMAAGMMNAWIGACYDLPGRDGAQRALQLLHAYDDISDQVQIYPDVVTLSLVYSIVSREDDSYQQMADSVLERAMKMSKKQGGSKRRRELAAARRRGPAVPCRDVQERLQDLYGPEFRVLQETGDYVVLSKPSGMVCFHKFKTTAGKAKNKRKTKGGKDKKKSNNKDVSLVDALLNENVALSTLNADGRGLVHRLDRGTSGCIVLAKTNEAHAKLVTQFFLRNAKKSYTAIVSSSLEEGEDTGEVNLPVDCRPAKSVYSVLERFDNGTTKVKMETLTGRKHQVRVHCAKGLQSPILLDPIYSDERENDDGRFLLHASSLCLPELGIDVQAPLPAWWAEEQAEFRLS